MDFSYSVEWRDGESSGYFVTLDEHPGEDSEWIGPFESYQAIHEYVMSILEQEALKLVRENLNI